MNQDYWFKRKRYGYGWTPTTWQGWLLMVLFTVAIITGAAGILGINQENPSLSRVIGFFAFVLSITIILLWATAQKAPKAKWRWGQKPDDNPHEDY